MSTDLMGYSNRDGFNPDFGGFSASTTNHHVSNMSGYPRSLVIEGPRWKTSTLPTSTTNNRPLYCGSGVFILPTASGTSLYRSFNYGLTWQTITLPSSQEWNRPLTNGRGLIVILPSNGSTSATGIRSTDYGLTWQTMTMPSTSFWYAGGFSNNYFFALVYGSSTIYSSLDGITWTANTLPGVGNWRGVGGNRKGVVVIVSDNSAIYRSADNGKTWAAPLVSPTSSYYNPIYGNGVFVLTNGLGTNTIWVSTDYGLRWQSITMPGSATETWTYCIYSNNFFMMSSSNSTNVATSTDGKTWAISQNKKLSVDAQVAAGDGTWLMGTSGSTTIYVGT